ncbi:MAG: hypothetical protein DA405_02810 [Bacteroidetes bacterium]|nr:MAG: hypothetical protein DA405_02810 [Bacteroidota bacterium]
MEQDYGQLLLKSSSEKGQISAQESTIRYQNTAVLAFRGLALTNDQITTLMERIKSDYEAGYITPHSISFSYTPLNPEALEAILNNLAPSVTDIGLVNCKLDNYEASKLLLFLKNSSHIRMLCAEGNQISERLKNEFRRLAASRSNLFVMI